MVSPLVRALLDIGYLHFYLSFGVGNLRLKEMEDASEKLDKKLKGMVDLLLLNKEVPRDLVEDVLGAEVTQELVDDGILVRRSEGFQSRNLRLIVFNNLILFVQHAANPEVYFGDDSIALALYQWRPLGSRSLDLCAGSGIQTLVGASRSAHCDAVEINKWAASLCQVNAKINGFKDRVTVHCTNLQSFLKESKAQFDVVTINPPLLPIPSDVDYPFVGHGGNDGLDITIDAIDGAAPLLTAEGSVQFVGTGLGKEGAIHFADRIEKRAQSLGLSSRLHLLSKHELCIGGTMFDGLVTTTAVHMKLKVAEIQDRFVKHYQAMDATDLYFFYGAVSKGGNGRAIRIDLASQFFGAWFV